MTAPETIESLCFHLRNMADGSGDAIDSDRLMRACELLQGRQAAIAAAYEAAAQWLIKAGIAGDGLDDPLASAIRALATPDQIAALAAERAATVTVNPLVWDDIAPHHSKAALPLFGSIRAESWGGDYSVVWSVPGMCDTFTHGKWATLEAAQAAAQADYDARIRSAITITSEDAEITRLLPRAEVEALMEAAEITLAAIMRLQDDWGDYDPQGIHWSRITAFAATYAEGDEHDAVRMRKALTALRERMK